MRPRQFPIRSENGSMNGGRGCPWERIRRAALQVPVGVVGLRNCLFDMVASILRVCSGVLLAAVVFLGVGCGNGSDLGVEEGRYRLYVEGSVTDTLTGSAVVHPDENGRRRVELGERDRPGLSLELATRSQAEGRYNAVGPELFNGVRDDSLTGVRAFLSVAGVQFAATDGRFSVTETGEGRLGGTLDMTMDEQGEAVAGRRSVRVTGVLRATRP